MLLLLLEDQTSLEGEGLRHNFSKNAQERTKSFLRRKVDAVDEGRNPRMPRKRPILLLNPDESSLTVLLPSKPAACTAKAARTPRGRRTIKPPSTINQPTWPWTLLISACSSDTPLASALACWRRWGSLGASGRGHRACKLHSPPACDQSAWGSALKATLRPEPPQQRTMAALKATTKVARRSTRHRDELPQQRTMLQVRLGLLLQDIDS
mmetsp:Transcript_27870/g.64279  ORF Transcript_27870/g.64279 Transcript_27870/m.64279 type:complete len:210 (-) Transcript_27870:132-761(-)